MDPKDDVIVGNGMAWGSMLVHEFDKTYVSQK